MSRTSAWLEVAQDTVLLVDWVRERVRFTREAREIPASVLLWVIAAFWGDIRQHLSGVPQSASTFCPYGGKVVR